MTAKFMFAALALTLCTAIAQTPAPTPVQPAPTTNVVVAPQPAPVTADSAHVALKALQALKATNEAILKNQEATLRQLDAIEKESEQLRVFSGRF